MRRNQAGHSQALPVQHETIPGSAFDHGGCRIARITTIFVAASSSKFEIKIIVVTGGDMKKAVAK